MRFISLKGETSYDAVREWQKKIVDQKLNSDFEDVVIFLEHKPVITQGRGLQKTDELRPRHMPKPIVPKTMEFCETERGGDLTYHGPGQLVIYPIIHLKELRPADYLRVLERIFIEELGSFGLKACAKEQATGVWVDEKKVASIGIAVRKGVSYHGVAINVVNDLKPFHLFSPCGFNSEVMTKLEDLSHELKLFVDDNWRAKLEDKLAVRFAEHFGESFSRVESVEFQEDLLL